MKWTTTVVTLRLGGMSDAVVDHIKKVAPTMGQLSVWLQRQPYWHDIAYPKKRKEEP